MSTPGDATDPIREARQRALAEFERPGPLPAEARPDEAEAQLLAQLERELGVTIAEAPPVPERRPAVHPAGGGVQGFFARWFGGPGWRSALALGGVIAIAVGAWSLLGPGREESRLRGPAMPGGAWNADPEVRIIVPPSGSTGTDGGGVMLKWNPAPRATHYAVVFLAPDLTEIARVEDVRQADPQLPGSGETALFLRKDRLPSGLTSASEVLWRVTAYAGEDEIARSPATPVQLP